MSGIQLISSENSSRAQNVDRYFSTQHRSHLNWRGVGSKNKLLLRWLNKKCVLHSSSWVVSVKIQSVEVKPLAFNFWPFGNFPTHSHKYVGNLLLKQAQWMTCASSGDPAQSSDVNSFFLQKLGFFNSRKFALSRLEGFGDFCPCGANNLSRFSFLVRG